MAAQGGKEKGTGFGWKPGSNVEELLAEGLKEGVIELE